MEVDMKNDLVSFESHALAATERPDALVSSGSKGV